MPSTGDLEKIPRKDLHIFYVLDTSGSMEGTRIAQLNRAVEECQIALGDVAKKNADANLKMAVMEYNTNPSWVTTNGPEEPDDFVFTPLKAGGLTEIGAALNALDAKLSRNGFLNSMTGALMPVIIFMTDGYATDDPRELEKALQNIQRNKWFSRGTKIGFAIGDDADKPLLERIVGKEAVIQTDDMETFVKLIKMVSVTASMLASTSKTPESATGNDEIVKTVITEIGKDPEDFGLSPEPVTPSATPSSDDDEFEDDDFGDDDDWD